MQTRAKASPGYDQLIVDIDVQTAPLLVHQAQADMLPLGQRHQQGAQHVPLAEGLYPQLACKAIFLDVIGTKVLLFTVKSTEYIQSGNRRFLAYITFHP